MFTAKKCNYYELIIYIKLFSTKIKYFSIAIVNKRNQFFKFYNASLLFQFPDESFWVYKNSLTQETFNNLYIPQKNKQKTTYVTQYLNITLRNNE